MGGTTIAAQVRCDDPVLRPGRARALPVVVSANSTEPVERERETFQLTFQHAAVWDVARIATPLRLRRTQYPKRSFFEVLTG